MALAQLAETESDLVTEIRPYRDANWLNGTAAGPPSGVWLAAGPEATEPGDRLIFANGSERRVLYAWPGGNYGGSQVFFEGPPLDPYTIGAAPPVRIRRTDVLTRTAPYSDANWLNGTTGGPPPGVWLDAPSDVVKAGYWLEFSNGWLAKVVQVWSGGAVGGCQVFFAGDALNPFTQGAPAVVRIRRPNGGAFLEPTGITNFTASAILTPKKGGGFFGGVLNALGDAAGAVGSVAGTALNVAGDVVDVARNSVVAQVAAAIATGGTSLILQAGLEAATGAGGPITSTARRLAEDPLSVVKQLPGDILTEGITLPGGVTLVDLASAAGSVARNVFGEDSKVGGLGAQVQDTVETVQQAARDNPGASAEALVGAAGTAFGVPGAKNLLQDGINQILADAAGGSEEHEASAVPEEVLPAEAPGVDALVQAQAAADAKAATDALRLKVGLGLMVTVAGLGLGGWALASAGKKAA